MRNKLLTLGLIFGTYIINAQTSDSALIESYDLESPASTIR